MSSLTNYKLFGSTPQCAERLKEREENVWGVGSAGSRLRGAGGIYYPRGPFAADLQQLPLQRVQEKQWGQKYKLSRCERGYRMAVLTE